MKAHTDEGTFKSTRTGNAGNQRLNLIANCLILYLAGLSLLGCTTPKSALPINFQEMPATFSENLIFLNPVTTSGQRLNWFSDTGGGTFIFENMLDSLDLPPAYRDSNKAPWPAFREDRWIPPPDGDTKAIFILKNVRRMVASESWTGMLGALWFRSRTWHFDYAEKRLHLVDSTATYQFTGDTVALGFLKDDAGAHRSGFPRIEVLVEGEPLQMLFDTGAQIFLKKAARQQLHQNGGPLMATSFISDSIFQQWQRAHPEWRVIDNADSNLSGQPMIAVPEVKIGQTTIGPVWFTRRPHKNFSEYMSQWMDRKVVGAIGGSAFQYYRFLLSYPDEIVILQRLRSNSPY